MRQGFVHREGLKKRELANLPGSASIKLALAELLRKQTSVSQGWIAEKPEMHSAANLSQQLRRVKMGELEKRLSKPMRDFLKNAQRDR